MHNVLWLVKINCIIVATPTTFQLLLNRLRKLTIAILQTNIAKLTNFCQPFIPNMRVNKVNKGKFNHTEIVNLVVQINTYKYAQIPLVHMTNEPCLLMSFSADILTPIGHFQNRRNFSQFVVAIR